MSGPVLTGIIMLPAGHIVTNGPDQSLGIAGAKSRDQASPRTPGRSSCGARGEDDPQALRVARGRVAARHRRRPLPAWRRSRCRTRWHAPGRHVGAAQHGGHAARRSLLRRPLGTGVVRASDSDPSARRSLDPDSPTLTFGSVGGSSQIGLRPGPVRRPPHPLQRMGYIRRNRRGAR